MPNWAMVLHFYQPPTQSPHLTEEILRQCYLPLCDLILNSKDVKLTINLSASLLLQTQTIPGHDFAQKMTQIYQSGKAEFLNSPIYHPLSPLTPSTVLSRQLAENAHVLKSICQIEPQGGVFPPELALDEKSLQTLASGAKYILVDESSINPNFNLNIIPQNPILNLKSQSSNLKSVVVSRSISEIIRAYPTELHAASLSKYIIQNTKDAPLVTLSDAEVFGHHYSERINLLRDLLTQKKFNFLSISDLISNFKFQISNLNSVTPSTWQTTQQDLKNNNPYPMWNAPHNLLQNFYWRLSDVAYEALARFESEFVLTQTEPFPLHMLHSAQHHYDQGISSCHPYWLSNNPWWHPDMAEHGAQQLIKCIRTLPVDKEYKIKAESIYHQFLMDLWQHHWSGIVEENYQKFEEVRSKQMAALPKL